jgi:hypothetical protein
VLVPACVLLCPISLLLAPQKGNVFLHATYKREVEKGGLNSPYARMGQNNTSCNVGALS